MSPARARTRTARSGDESLTMRQPRLHLHHIKRPLMRVLSKIPVSGPPLDPYRMWPFAKNWIHARAPCHSHCTLFFTILELERVVSGYEATWDWGYVGLWSRGCIAWHACCGAAACCATDVSEIYKLVAYIPVMFFNPLLEGRLKFMYHNI